jgi:hypothetical protein
VDLQSLPEKQTGFGFQELITHIYKNSMAAVSVAVCRDAKLQVNTSGIYTT